MDAIRFVGEVLQRCGEAEAVAEIVAAAHRADDVAGRASGRDALHVELIPLGQLVLLGRTVGEPLDPDRVGRRPADPGFGGERHEAARRLAQSVRLEVAILPRPPTEEGQGVGQTLFDLHLDTADVAVAAIDLRDFLRSVDDAAGAGADDVILDVGVEPRSRGPGALLLTAHADFEGGELLGIETGRRGLNFTRAGEVEAGEVGEIRGTETLRDAAEERVDFLVVDLLHEARAAHGARPFILERGDIARDRILRTADVRLGESGAGAEPDVESVVDRDAILDEDVRQLVGRVVRHGTLDVAVVEAAVGIEILAVGIDAVDVVARAVGEITDRGVGGELG